MLLKSTEETDKNVGTFDLFCLFFASSEHCVDGEIFISVCSGSCDVVFIVLSCLCFCLLLDRVSLKCMVLHFSAKVHCYKYIYITLKIYFFFMFWPPLRLKWGLSIRFVGLETMDWPRQYKTNLTFSLWTWIRGAFANTVMEAHSCAGLYT